MKKKKIFALLMAVCMTVSLTACGGTKEETQGETTQMDEMEEAAEDTETKVEPAREAELNIMMSFPQYMDQWEAYCRQFEEKMLKKKILR